MKGIAKSLLLTRVLQDSAFLRPSISWEVKTADSIAVADGFRTSLNLRFGDNTVKSSKVTHMTFFELSSFVRAAAAAAAAL